ncbi:hypothetical protein [Dactylosporangium sp. CA-233914]|uniref:hypothetical protein n=1 Tax=Dactylosporangium sp. CA-233914 TaxID=3239934 RepID=UPI003D8D0567
MMERRWQATAGARWVARLVHAVPAVLLLALFAPLAAGPPVARWSLVFYETPAPGEVKYYIVNPPTDGQPEFLFAIAQKTLGNGKRYTEIFDINKNRPQPDGGRLTDPMVLHAGWILVLPGDATGSGVRVGPPPVASRPAGAPMDETGSPGPGDGGTAAASGTNDLTSYVVRVGALAAAVLALVLALWLVRKRRSPAVAAVGPPAEAGRSGEPRFAETVWLPRKPRPVADDGPDAPPPPDRPGPPAEWGPPGDTERPARPGPDRGRPTRNQRPGPADDDRRGGDGLMMATSRHYEPEPPRPELSGPPGQSAGDPSPDTPPSIGADPAAAEPALAVAPELLTSVVNADRRLTVRLTGVRPLRRTRQYVWLAPGEQPPRSVVPLELGGLDGWRLHVDLAASPDVVTIVGPAGVCGALAGDLAGQALAAGLSVTVVGDALAAADVPDGCHRVAAFPGVDGEPEPADRPGIVICGALRGPALLAARRMMADSRGHLVPVVVGSVPGSRWSVRVAGPDEPVESADQAGPGEAPRLTG